MWKPKSFYNEERKVEIGNGISYQTRWVQISFHISTMNINNYLDCLNERKYGHIFNVHLLLT